MSASLLPGYFESGGYTERKKERTKTKVIQNPGDACAEERQGDEQSKVARLGVHSAPDWKGAAIRLPLPVRELMALNRTALKRASPRERTAGHLSGSDRATRCPTGESPAVCLERSRRAPALWRRGEVQLDRLAASARARLGGELSGAGLQNQRRHFLGAVDADPGAEHPAARAVATLLVRCQPEALAHHASTLAAAQRTVNRNPTTRCTRSGARGRGRPMGMRHSPCLQVQTRQ